MIVECLENSIDYNNKDFLNQSVRSGVARFYDENPTASKPKEKNRIKLNEDMIKK